MREGLKEFGGGDEIVCGLERGWVGLVKRIMQDNLMAGLLKHHRECRAGATAEIEADTVG